MPSIVSFANETQSSWFIQLRWIAVGIGIDTVVLFWLLFPGHLNTLPLLGIFAGLALLNLAYSWAQRRVRLSLGGALEKVQQLHQLLNLQIGGDLLVLFLLLLGSGGLQNPLIFLYLLHIVIVSILFPPKESLRYSAVISLFPWALFFWEWAGWTPTRLEFWPYQFSLIEEAARLAVFLLVAVGLWLIVSRLSEDLRGKEAKLKVFGDDLTEVRNQLTMVEGHRSRLLANLAKELKPPVEALEADLKKAQKALLKKETRVLTKLLRHLQVELSGLKDVSGDLDWLATPEWPQRAYRREWVDWALLSRRTITHLSPAAADKGLALKGVSPQKLVLPGDRLALQQVLSQLVGNAIKYTPAGSGEILVELKRESPYALLTVTDRGIGIPEEDKKNLFGEFFRGKRAETSGEPGSGLGLFIVKKILDWHQGIIKVESASGKGTTVKVWLPMREHEKAGKKLG